MIVELIFRAFTFMVEQVLGPLMFDVLPPPPAWVNEGVGYLQDFWALLGSFETWLPVDTALGVAGALTLVFLLSLAIGFARMVASYVTLGGGT